MIKKLTKIFIISLQVIFLTSCWDYKDINDKSIVMYLGVGKVGDSIQLTAEVFQRTNAGTAGQNNKMELLNVGPVVGRDLEELRVKLAQETTLEMYMSTNRIFIFGRNLAEEGVEPYVQLIDRAYDQRKTADLVVLEQAPIKLYDINPEKQRSNGFIIEDVVNYLKLSGQIVNDSLYEIRAASNIEGVGFLLPYVDINEHKFINVAGEAVFKDYKLVHIYSMNEVDGIVSLVGDPVRLIEMVTEDGYTNNRYECRRRLAPHASRRDGRPSGMVA